MEKQGQIIFYETPDGKVNINVLFRDDTVWMTAKSISELFEIDYSNILKHIKNIYKEGELAENATMAKNATVVSRGFRGEVEGKIDFYSLEMIISLGYRVNSEKATAFRQWATLILKEYTQKGFVLDDKRLKQGKQFDKNYFRELLDRIKEIRVSERMLYQQLKDIYALSADYNPKSRGSIFFFANVQNKVHFAITGQTASEIVYNRSDHQKENMGLTSWEGNRITKADVIIAKNYLEEGELQDLKDIIVMFLDFAEYKARKQEVVFKKDWIDELDSFLTFNKLKVLNHKGSVSQLSAGKKAVEEYRLYRNAQIEKQNSEKEIEYKEDLKHLEELAKKGLKDETN